jgi:hypothetical protein
MYIANIDGERVMEVELQIPHWPSMKLKPRAGDRKERNPKSVVGIGLNHFIVNRMQRS